MENLVGKQIAYIREIQGKEQTKEGGGRVKSLHLNADGRFMCHIQDDELDKEGKIQIFTIAVGCVDPSEEFKDKFRALVDEIDVLAAEATAKNQELMDDYNGRINKLKDELLGKPLETNV